MPQTLTAPADSSRTTTLLFFSTHEVTPTDARILRAYQAELASEPGVELWVLLLRSCAARHTHNGSDESNALPPVSTFVWNEEDVAALYPRLGAAVHRGDGGLASETDPHLRRYYWLSSALGLFRHAHVDAHGGEASRYPALRWWWRIEPDLVFAGKLGYLLARAARYSTADVLLPSGAYNTPAIIPGYPHWATNAALLSDVPARAVAYSLVCLARYSSRFVGLLQQRLWAAARGPQSVLMPRGASRGHPCVACAALRYSSLQAAGRLGYEEISIPTLCLNTTGCTLDDMNSRTLHLTARVRFEPDWPCAEFVDARKRGSHDCWHPVKQRECYAAWLEKAAPARPSGEAESEARAYNADRGGCTRHSQGFE